MTDFTAPDPAPLPAPAAELTLSEERLRVDTRSFPIGKAVLRKTIVVEQRTITVEVRREEAQLQVLPYDTEDGSEENGGHGAHVALPDLVLHREEIVITKRIVPVERVRLELRPVTVQRTVTKNVRHEEIETGDSATSA